MSRRLRPLLPAGVLADIPVPAQVASQTPVRDMMRACDPCRKRKIRCDGQQHEDRICSTCRRLKKKCVYTDEFARSAAAPEDYVAALEARVRKAEDLLTKRFPDLDLMRELGALHLEPAAKQAFGTSDQVSSDDDEHYHVASLADPSASAMNEGFFGKSSEFPLARKAVKTKATLQNGVPLPQLNFIGKRPEFWRPPRYSITLVLPPPDQLALFIDHFFAKVNFFSPLLHRPLFEKQLEENMDDEQFVATVLLVSACGARAVAAESGVEGIASFDGAKAPGWEWFEQVEPLLHVPTFSTPTLHEIQMFILAFMYLMGITPTFTAPWTVLGVAIRVALQAGAHRATAYRSKQNLIDELWKRAFWILVVLDRHLTVALGRGSALRDESFDIPAPLEVDDDCWDLSNPAESYPLAGQQPRGRPSYISYSIQHARLTVILGTATRTIYTINRSKVLMGFLGEEWQQRVRRKLNTMLDEWTRGIPQHLHWDPDRIERQWFCQAAALHTSYYHAQIIIHNPFPFIRRSQSTTPYDTPWQASRRPIPETTPAPASTASSSETFSSSDATPTAGTLPSTSTPTSSSTSTRPHPPWTPTQASSFAICTNAAHACSRIFAEQLRLDARIMPVQIGSAFHSALVLLVNLWGAGKDDGRASEEYTRVILDDLRACMTAIKRLEPGWARAGRMWKFLRFLAMPHDVEEPIPIPLQQVPQPVPEPPQTQQHSAAGTGLPGFPAQYEHVFAASSSAQQTQYNQPAPTSWPAPQSQLHPAAAPINPQYNYSSLSTDPMYYPAAAFPVPSLPLDTTMLSHMPAMGFEHPMFSTTEGLTGVGAGGSSDDLPMGLQMLLGSGFMGHSGDTPPPELHMTQPPTAGAGSGAGFGADFGVGRGGRGRGGAGQFAGMGRGMGRGAGAAAFAAFGRGGFAGGASG